MGKIGKNLLILSVSGAVLVGGYYFIKSNSQPGKLDEFAKCLKNSGATFYGAFWCPHCQSQKKMFEKSVKYLPYIECSTADGRGQLQVCKDKNIQGYPTWEFADGSKETGEVSLEKLAERTNCSLSK